MNQLTNAFINAGIKLPSTKERLWRVIKDEPGLTQAQLAKRLTGIPIGTISSQLHGMEERGMVYVVGTKGRGPSGKAKAYHTDMETYQLLPMPERNGKKAATAQAEPPAETKRQPVEMSIDLDSLTIREAKALYLKLKEMFE
jgi:hypothetical protein